MPTKHPHINLNIERPLFSIIAQLAEKNEISLSLQARDLIREAIEEREDEYWLARVEKREDTFIRRKARNHKQVWKSLSRGS